MIQPLTHWGRHIGVRSQLFLSGVLFGLMAALARIAAKGGFSAGQLSLVRFAVGAGLMLALFAVRPGTYAPVNRRLLLTRGALGGLAACLYFVALSRIPAGEATLLNNTFPLLATAFAFFTLRERPTVHLAIGLAIASVGVFLVLGGGTTSFRLGWGELAGISSALLGAGAVTAIRALRATDNAPTIFFAFCLGGLLISWPFALGPWPMHGGLWVLALVGVALDVILRDWMLPHYALEDASAGEAWEEVWDHITAEKSQFAVYALLRLILPVIAMIGLFIVLLIPGLMVAGSVAAIVYAIHSAFADATGASALVGILLQVFFGVVAFCYALLAGICLGGPLSTGVREYALIFYGGRYQALGDLLYPSPPLPFVPGTY